MKKQILILIGSLLTLIIVSGLLMVSIVDFVVDPNSYVTYNYRNPILGKITFGSNYENKNKFVYPNDKNIPVLEGYDIVLGQEKCSFEGKTLINLEGPFDSKQYIDTKNKTVTLYRDDNNKINDKYAFYKVSGTSEKMNTDIVKYKIFILDSLNNRNIQDSMLTNSSPIEFKNYIQKVS